MSLRHFAVRCRALMAVCALLIAMPAVGRDSPPAPAPTCELHVWPGRSFHSVLIGWAHGGTVDGAQKGRRGYGSMPDEPLGVPIQLEAMRKLDLPSLLGLAGYSTTFHDAPLSAAAIRLKPGRQLADSPDCYAELMIDDIVLQNNAINGKWLNVIMQFRQFDGSTAEPVNKYGTYVLSRLSLFPPEKDAQDIEPALDELANAFASSIANFGKEYAAHLKRGGKKKGASITL